MTKASRLWFLFGDCVAGATTGLLTALVVHAIVWRECDMVVAMALGMLAGMVVHLALGVLFLPLLGIFETMVPGMCIAMYGGMLFGMRDAMQEIDLITTLEIGAAFGSAVALGVAFWNAQLRGSTCCASQPADSLWNG